MGSSGPADSLIDDPYGVGGRAVPFYDQTLAEVISRVRAADDWNDDSVDVSNFHARISVSVVPMLGGNPASDDLDLSEVGLLEQNRTSQATVGARPIFS